MQTMPPNSISKFLLENLLNICRARNFISCLGLFGLSAYIAERRTKEIGIRKVLGASIPQVWLLLSKDFIVLVMISCVIASPIALYFLQNWLMKYEYRDQYRSCSFHSCSIDGADHYNGNDQFPGNQGRYCKPIKELENGVVRTGI